MPQTSEIKIYETAEEIQSDYENFRTHWKYDREKESGVHDSGIGMSKVMMGGSVKIKYHGLPEWVEDMRQCGLSEEQIDEYRRMIKNQFVTICEKEPYVERELSIEERRKRMEKSDEWKIEMAKKYHHYSEEQLQQMAERLAKGRDIVIKRWEERGKKSDR